MSRFIPSGEIEVDSVRYGWAVRHYGGMSNPYAKARGISVGVWLPGKHAKELILDFAFVDHFFAKPKSTREFEARLGRCIRGALASGWNPDSRGKPFRLDAATVDTPVPTQVPGDSQ